MFKIIHMCRTRLLHPHRMIRRRTGCIHPALQLPLWDSYLSFFSYQSLKSPPDLFLPKGFIFMLIIFK